MAIDERNRTPKRDPWHSRFDPPVREGKAHSPMLHRRNTNARIVHCYGTGPVASASPQPSCSQAKSL